MDDVADAELDAELAAPAGRWESLRPRLAAAGRRVAVASRSVWAMRARVVVFALAGTVLAPALVGHVPAKVGPFETTFAARPSLSGHTLIRLAPLGSIDLDTHDAPVTLEARVDEISVADAERIADNPRAIERLGDEAT